MAKIDYFFSLLSPFTYLAGMGLEKVAAKHGAEIIYRPTDIMAVFAETGGVPVPQRHPFRQEYRLQELKRLSARAGLSLNIKPLHWPTDAAPASCAVIAVAAQGGDAGTLAHAFLRAVWAEDRDIADPGVVADVLSAHGYDAAAMADALAAAETEFAANKDLALANGVFGAPFYVVDGERFWGQDRLDMLDWHLGQM
ncbi:MAG: 2-hydroxychromene-2-carboxylate isomerase [Pseudomonadota bacterium]